MAEPVLQAYQFALDPTPAQERKLASRAPSSSARADPFSATTACSVAARRTASASGARF
jgi:hypothetical protein